VVWGSAVSSPGKVRGALGRKHASL